MILRYLLWLVGVSRVVGMELRGSVPRAWVWASPLPVFGVTVAGVFALLRTLL